ncbi:Hypothetical protein CAP_4512 [Chondromyces apiculatus DSM 436]|uniref:Uncharacterized protein n=1 Tax=Chondromyces apiculatus DSM 436 TaxID=1192034 RepID=A0A017T522_9BACT|nr:Hypothetical protein CAP_4512 [Chondromyces apiculatus DSM 436]
MLPAVRLLFAVGCRSRSVWTMSTMRMIHRIVPRTSMQWSVEHRPMA